MVILSNTLILPMSQLQTQQLMTSRIRSHMKYLIHTKNILLLILYSKLTRNIAVLAVFNTIQWWSLIVAYFFGPSCIIAPISAGTFCTTHPAYSNAFNAAGSCCIWSWYIIMCFSFCRHEINLLHNCMYRFDVFQRHKSMQNCTFMSVQTARWQSPELQRSLLHSVADLGFLRRWL